MKWARSAQFQRVRYKNECNIFSLIFWLFLQVRGQISDMALCIVDDISKISNLAKLFFTELARKGNALYNIMPDIISGLSDTKVGVAEDKFREIMKYIIRWGTNIGGFLSYVLDFGKCISVLKIHLDLFIRKWGFELSLSPL